MTRRIAELPSLRYGTVGTNSIKSGPLRVSDACRYDTLPKASSKKYRELSYSTENLSLKSTKQNRRVHFDLPPSESGACIPGADVVNQTAGDYTLQTSVVSHRTDCSKLPASVQHRESQPRAKAAVPANSCFKRSSVLFGDVSVNVTNSPAPRYRVHPTGRYIRGTLSPTANSAAPTAANPGGLALLRAARDGDDVALRDVLRRASLAQMPENELNAADNSGRTAVSYIASNGTIELLEQIFELPGLDANIPDNEGNTPLHFAAQAGHVECLNILLTRCKGIEIDAKNNLGFTPLMKAALQGRNKCAKLLLFAGANPTLRDSGRGLRADQWARFCGRYVCADVIEKHARQRLLERSTSYGNWGGENDSGTRVLLGKVVPVPHIPQPQHGIKSKLKRVFRTSSGPSSSMEHHMSSARLVTQLTTAALCASSPVLPSTPGVPQVVKSLIRPLTVPRLQVTLVNNNNEEYQSSNIMSNNGKTLPEVIQSDKHHPIVIKSAIARKKK